MDQDLRKDFHEKLWELMHSMRRYHMSLRHRQSINPLEDASRGRGRILALLKIQDNMTSKDLGYLLGIRQQSLNESLKRLEKEGCVVREPDQRDRRVMRVRLTAKGRQVKQNQEQDDDVLATFSDDELKSFGSYVDRLRHAYEKHIAAGLDNADKKLADEMQEHMAAMRERMGTDRFDAMMRRGQQMGMPMGPGCMGHRRGFHHGHCGY